MHISDMNWMQVEAYLKTDNRAILPLGCTEQHAYLSLSVDSILAEKMAIDASESEGVPVFPVLAYGITPAFRAYQGTISLRMETYFHILRDILDHMVEQGFQRILIVNGHGGNSPASSYVGEWLATQADEVSVIWHDWWRAKRTMKAVRKIDQIGSHASWMENFAWTRLKGVDMPNEQKELIDYHVLRQLNPKQAREYLGDGNFGGYYQRDDAEMQRIWDVAVEETRDLLVNGWVKS